MANETPIIGTDTLEIIMDKLPMVHWSIARCQGVLNTLEYLKQTGKAAVVFTDDNNIPYIRIMKDVE